MVHPLGADRQWAPFLGHVACSGALVSQARGDWNTTACNAAYSGGEKAQTLLQVVGTGMARLLRVEWQSRQRGRWRRRRHWHGAAAVAAAVVGKRLQLADVIVLAAVSAAPVRLALAAWGDSSASTRHVRGKFVLLLEAGPRLQQVDATFLASSLCAGLRIPFAAGRKVPVGGSRPLGMGHGGDGSGCQSRSPLLPAYVAHVSTNREGSSGSHVATAHGRFAEAFPKGPCARAGTHGAGMPPLECGTPLRSEGLYRAGARPML